MKKIIVIILALVMAFSLNACAAKTETQPAAEQQVQATPEPTPVKIEITDMKGRTITLEKLPERIVSLSPSNTEILFALGAGSKVVGVTNYCTYPEEAAKLEKIGDFEGANLELIKKAQPDIVFAGGYIQEDLVKSLEDLNITVLSSEALDIKGIYDSIRMIAKATGTDAKAEEIIADMQSRIKAIEDKTKNKEKPKVFYVVWTDPLTTAGADTFINDIIKAAGGINTAEKVSNWAKYSPEELLKDNPEMLIASNFCTPDGVSKEYFKNSPIFNKLECVKNDKIYMISSDDIFSRSGPRIVQAIEELAKLFHGI
ncbi:MAG: helical backbone metal receptor [Bacillota bacterium]